MVSRAVCSCHCCGKKKKKKLHSPQSRNTNGAVFTEATIVLLIFSPPLRCPDGRLSSECVFLCVSEVVRRRSYYRAATTATVSTIKTAGWSCAQWSSTQTQARTNSRVGAVRKVQMKIDACINEQNVSFVITFFVYLRRHIYRAMMVRVIPAPDTHTQSRLATQLQASQWGYD